MPVNWTVENLLYRTNCLLDTGPQRNVVAKNFFQLFGCEKWALSTVWIYGPLQMNQSSPWDKSNSAEDVVVSVSVQFSLS